MSDIEIKETNSYTDRPQRRAAMRLSMLEGAFAITMVALVEAFYVPYLHAMGATPLQLGLGVSLPALMSAFVQLCTSWALHQTGSRRKLAVATCLVQAGCFVPFGLLCHLQTPGHIWLAIAAFLVSATAGNLGAAAWADWMADLVPSRRRGKFFAMRNRVLGGMQLVVAVAAGCFLDHALGKVLIIFTIIWLVCFFARCVSGLLNLRMYEPPSHPRPPAPLYGFWRFMATLPHHSFGRFALAASWLTVGVNFSGPFFAVHMLKNLHFSYTQYTIVLSMAIATTIATLGLWGRIIDRLGAVVALRVSTLIVALLPILWVVWDDFWLLLVIQFLAGISWSGFNLAAFVYYLDSTMPQERVTKIAYFNVLNFLGVFAGATLGGILAPHLPVLEGKFALQSVFLLSGMIRFPAAMIFQFLPAQEAKGRLTAMEKLFLDPRLSMRTGITRSIMRHFRRTI